MNTVWYGLMIGTGLFMFVLGQLDIRHGWAEHRRKVDEAFENNRFDDPVFVDPRLTPWQSIIQILWFLVAGILIGVGAANVLG